METKNDREKTPRRDMSGRKTTPDGPAPRIFVIGFPGSDRVGTARRLAAELAYRLVDLDSEIEQADGRSILRICMTMGEHEYRNQEFKALQRLQAETGVVVACGDGVVLDEMSRAILAENTVVIADKSLSPEELWVKAQAQQEDESRRPLPYAFMRQPDIDRRREQFLALCRQRAPLYQEFF